MYVRHEIYPFKKDSNLLLMIPFWKEVNGAAAFLENLSGSLVVAAVNVVSM
jgi:hypothetical protein